MSLIACPDCSGNGFHCGVSMISGKLELVRKFCNACGGSGHISDSPVTGFGQADLEELSQKCADYHHERTGIPRKSELEIYLESLR